MKTIPTLLIGSVLVAIALQLRPSKPAPAKPGFEVSRTSSATLAAFHWGITQKPYCPAPTKSVTADELERILTMSGVDSNVIHTVDHTYTIPEIKWWDKFLPDFDNLMINFGYRYTPEIEDCDDFSRLFATATQHTFRLQYKQVREAVLVGEFHYKSESQDPHKKGPHVINVVGAWENGMPGLKFVEPQSGKFVTLSRSEMASCYFLRF